MPTAEGSRGRSAVLHAGAGYPSQGLALRAFRGPPGPGVGMAWEAANAAPVGSPSNGTGPGIIWDGTRQARYSPREVHGSLDFEPPLRRLGSSGLLRGRVGRWGWRRGGGGLRGTRRRARVRPTIGLQYPLSCAGEPACPVGRGTSPAPIGPLTRGAGDWGAGGRYGGSSHRVRWSHPRLH